MSNTPLLNAPTLDNYLRSLGPYLLELARADKDYKLNDTSLVDFKTESFLRGYQVLDIEADPLIIFTWIEGDLYKLTVKSSIPDSLELEINKCDNVKEKKEVPET